MLEHRQAAASTFPAQYQISGLVHFEIFADIHAAIDRETQIKAYRREKKIRLIENKNPTWEDLAKHLSQKTKADRSPHSQKTLRMESRMTK
jgi:predicted GIY-YIG superfamily endonuclease